MDNNSKDLFIKKNLSPRQIEPKNISSVPVGRLSEKLFITSYIDIVMHISISY